MKNIKFNIVPITWLLYISCINRTLKTRRIIKIMSKIQIWDQLPLRIQWVNEPSAHLSIYQMASSFNKMLRLNI